MRQPSNGFKPYRASPANACPANRSCQLQYIPVAARCAPDLRAGASNPQYFCAGS